jgi:membrane associated rhomboid family serine protease
VRSRQQALDWSLVLISQGIETTIDYPGPDNDWALLISPQDYQRALFTLRQYRLENRHWPWRREIFGPHVVFDWASLAWVFLLAVFYWSSTRIDLRSAGCMDSTALAASEWWRLFTAISLHADPGHLAANATIGLVLLGLVMGRYGTGVGLLAAYLTGAGGNLVAWLLSPAPHVSLGASGMVMGCLGLLAIHSLSTWRQGPHAAKYVISGIAAGVMLFALFGLAPETDVLAHLGGFVFGILLGALLTLIPNVSRQNKTNLVCGLLFGLLAVAPWCFAARASFHKF